MYTGILVSSNLHLCRLAVYFHMSFFWWFGFFLIFQNQRADGPSYFKNLKKTNSFHERTDQGTEILKKTSEMKLKWGVCKKNSTFVTESGQQTFLSHMLKFFPIHQCHIFILHRI